LSERLVSVVIGSFNRKAFLRLAIDSVRRELADLPAEIIVVDGGSDDGSVEWLVAQKDIVSVVQHNRGAWRGKPLERRSWGYFMNLGFRCAQGKYVCMLSDDCLVVPGAIRSGMEDAERLAAQGRKVGAVAFYWRNWPEQTRYWVGRTFGGRLFVNHGLYLREALAAVDYIDERSYAFYHADGDLCLKMAERGYECVAASASYIEHYAQANQEVRESNLAVQKRDWQRYTDKWSALDAGLTASEREPWITRDYEDPHHTARQFRKLRPVKIAEAHGKLRHGVQRLKRALRGRKP
jgi:glycosyltransferase involved in cell wall biosynthesis